AGTNQTAYRPEHGRVSLACRQTAALVLATFSQPDLRTVPRAGFERLLPGRRQILLHAPPHASRSPTGLPRPLRFLLAPHRHSSLRARHPSTARRSLLRSCQRDSERAVAFSECADADLLGREGLRLR